MIAAVDLHIHSALSPCADNEMTPNNIVNMASLKGLDIIAVTDHNSVENCIPSIKCGRSAGVLVIPGMELQTVEEIHILCFFPDFLAAEEMQRKVYAALSPVPNNEEIFGQQLLFDELDEVRGKNERLLIGAASINIDDACRYVETLGGVVVPAHVDREEYGIISAFGAIPKELGFNYLEVSRKCDLNRFKESNPGLKDFKYIRSSDAHYLGDLLEKEAWLDVPELSTNAVISVLRSR